MKIELLKTILLSLTLLTISINLVYSQSNETINLYDEDLNIFRLPPEIIQDLIIYKDKASNEIPLLEKEIYKLLRENNNYELQVNYYDSLKTQLKFKIELIQSKYNKSYLKYQESEYLYKSCITNLNSANLLIDKQHQEIKTLKQNSFWKKIWNFGWGPITIRNVIYGIIGYTIGTNIN